jgi:hypothetical protein
MRDAPFFVIDYRLEEDVWFARMDGGTFIGDVSMFTGEPTRAAGVAIEPPIRFSAASAGDRAH